MIDKTKYAPIWILKETKESIDRMKVHPNQSYHEVVSEILVKSEKYDKYCAALDNDCR